MIPPDLAGPSREDLLDTVDRLNTQVDHLKERVKVLSAPGWHCACCAISQVQANGFRCQRDLMRDALLRLEWSDGGSHPDFCPLCGNWESRGHKADCQMLLALSCKTPLQCSHAGECDNSTSEHWGPHPEITEDDGFGGPKRCAVHGCPDLESYDPVCNPVESVPERGEEKL